MAMLNLVAKRAVEMHKKYREEQAVLIINALAKALDKGSKNKPRSK